MSIRSLALISLSLFLSLSACRKQEGIRIKLTSRERALIDTMYMEKIKVLRPQWDSLCASVHDSLLEIALDSIIAVRRREELRLRSRIILPGDQSTEK